MTQTNPKVIFIFENTSKILTLSEKIANIVNENHMASSARFFRAENGSQNSCRKEVNAGIVSQIIEVKNYNFFRRVSERLKKCAICIDNSILRREFGCEYQHFEEKKNIYETENLS